MTQEKDFIFGVQYYRAPTPHPESWESDLKNIRENGFTHIKFWVQWRWTHRAENEFYFEDVDRLMDLAAKNDLKVTLNVIFDVVPKWVTDQYPESKIVLANGTVLEPSVSCYRQIGGYPGTCYNHEKAFQERMKFLAKTVERYKDHPAMHMWDVWNEPEQCSPFREAKKETLTCFCDSCKAKFIAYLQEKYRTIEKLNQVWGRCYRDFDDIELPKEPVTFGDFMDFREFHLDKMTREANSRLRVVHEIDKKHPAYLHVVPNTSGIFNAMTGVDDFELAKECDVFASTNFAQPIWSVLTLSAGAGKTCYNVECHVGAGTTKMHQKQIVLKDLAKELLPQIGMGIKGFMFWQYRPEILGFESPAWGVTKPDGTMGSVGKAAKIFIEKLSPYIPQILKSTPAKPEIAIWKGRKNEIFSFCINENMQPFAKTTEAYVNALYYQNLNCVIADDATIKKGLEGVKLLIMPYCYEADAELMEAVDRFVKEGGMLFCEAHLGGYNADAGRHSYRMPGQGMDEKWGILEDYTTSSYHLNQLVKNNDLNMDNIHDDVKKALNAYGLSGGKYFEIAMTFGFSVSGAERFACLKAENGEVIGTFQGIPCMLLKKYGKGCILYCGTNLGEAAEHDREAFEKLVLKVTELAGVKPVISDLPRGVHMDMLSEDMLIVHNETEEIVKIPTNGKFKGIFNELVSEENEILIEAKSAELLVKTK